MLTAFLLLLTFACAEEEAEKLDLSNGLDQPFELDRILVAGLKLESETIKKSVPKGVSDWNLQVRYRIYSIKSPGVEIETRRVQKPKERGEEISAIRIDLVRKSRSDPDIFEMFRIPYGLEKRDGPKEIEDKLGRPQNRDLDERGSGRFVYSFFDRSVVVYFKSNRIVKLEVRRR